jgi:hypothetical protein
LTNAAGVPTLRAVSRRRLQAGLATVLIAASFATLPTSALSESSVSTTSAARAESPGWVKTASTQLAKLKVRTAGSMAGYSRERFGPTWADVDGNGCDTRNDVLARDLRQVVFRAGSDCIVERGTLRDPYTGKAITFVRGVGTSLAVQVDHVVALAAAWRTGARRWTAERRLFYANDPAGLLAVDGPTNGSKSDQDAASWLPPNPRYHCRYVAKQVAIKTKYRLWVTQPERMAMRGVLADC